MRTSQGGSQNCTMGTKAKLHVTTHYFWKDVVSCGILKSGHELAARIFRDQDSMSSYKIEFTKYESMSKNTS